MTESCRLIPAEVKGRESILTTNSKGPFLQNKPDLQVDIWSMLTTSFAWQTKSITLGNAPETISQACPFMTLNIYFLYSFANILQCVGAGL